MKQFFLIGFLLLLHITSSAQGAYKYKLPKNTHGCKRGPDSIVINNISEKYENLGLSRQCYTYDDFGRQIESKYFQGDGNYLGNHVKYFFKPMTNGFCDSTVIIEHGSNGYYAKLASVAIYNKDSIRTGGFFYLRDEQNLLELLSQGELTYDIGPETTIVNSITWEFNNGVRSPTAMHYGRVVFRNNILVSDSSWALPNAEQSFWIEYHRYSGDTTIDYSVNHEADSVSYRTDVDSSVRIIRRVDNMVIRYTYNKNGSENSDHSQSYLFMNRGIDTSIANKGSVSYFFDESKGMFLPFSKTEKGHGSVAKGYRYVNNAWVLYSKSEGRYIDDNKECIGALFNYSWQKGSWELTKQTNYYYAGVTASATHTNGAPCKLPNPFSVSYPFSCEALVSDEEYTLRVFDLSGKKVLDEPFYVDQSIGELVMLPGENLYYFMITNSQNELISTQKILMND